MLFRSSSDPSSTSSLRVIISCPHRLYILGYTSISDILTFEKKECAHKGIIMRNVVMANREKISILATYLMKKYNFVYKKDSTEDKNADITRMCFGNAPISCAYTSCLGAGVVLLSNGEIAVCPYIKSSISLDDRLDVQSLQDIFNTYSFLKLLKANIERRSKCKENCQYFALCKGGCALEEFSFECSILSAIEKRKKQLSEYDMNNLEYREQRAIWASNMYKV